RGGGRRGDDAAPLLQCRRRRPARRGEGVRALQPEGAGVVADSPKVDSAAAMNAAICLNFRVYLTPARAVATYGANEKAYEGSHRNSPGRVLYPPCGARRAFRASRVSLPGPPLHSTVTPHPGAMGEGNNNKAFGP